MSRGGAVLASLLVTIGRPAWWLVALAGFLVRGGFVVFVLPIVLLPSPLAISNVVAPIIVPRRARPDRARRDRDLRGTVVAAVRLDPRRRLDRGGRGSDAHPRSRAAAGRGGNGASVADVPRRRAAGACSGGPATCRRRGDRVLIGRLLSARLIAWLPLAVAVGLGIVGVIAVTYAS